MMRWIYHNIELIGYMLLHLTQARGFIVRTRLNGLKRVAYFIQRVFRGFRTRLFLLRQRSATKMQKNWKIFWHHKIMAIRMQVGSSAPF